MAFNPKSPENKPIVQYLQGSKALIVDPTSITKSAIRKVLLSFGMKIQDIEVAESYDEAKQKLETHKQNLLFLEYALDKKTTLDLYKLQQTFFQDQLKTVCIVLSDQDSAAVTSSAAEADTDALLVRPVTYADIEKKILELLKEKANPSQYRILVENGKVLLKNQRYEDAIKLFQSAIELDAKPVLAYYYLGCTYHLSQNLEQAEKCYREGLKIDEGHYKTLFGLLDVLIALKQDDQAYAVGGKITDKYPMPPQRIPEFVHLAIRSNHFTDILSLYDLVKQEENLSLEACHYISAGLVVSGKYYFRQAQVKEALESFKKAELLSRGKPSILRNILSALYLEGFEKEAEQMLGRCPEEVKNSFEIPQKK